MISIAHTVLRLLVPETTSRWRQTESNDCGVISVQRICFEFNIPIPDHETILMLAGAKTTLLSNEEVAKVLTKLGFQPFPAQCKTRLLETVATPFIAMILRAKSYHFVVVNNVNAKFINYFDPGFGGQIHEMVQDFELNFTGSVIILRHAH